MSKIKCILPCAGLGTRMGMKNNEAKELLLDPTYQTPIIDYSLKICKDQGFTPVIISRKEKREFNRYVSGKAELLIIEPRGEWMDSILQSKDLWEEKNILILPDTRFRPIDEASKLVKDLDFCNLSFGLHFVKHTQNWGIVKQIDMKTYDVIEKPKDNIFCSTAWGIVAFKPEQGEQLFEGFRTKNQWFRVENASCAYLQSFKDITRTGKIEDA